MAFAASRNTPPDAVAQEYNVSGTAPIVPAPSKAYVPPTKFSEEQMSIIRADAPVVVGQAFAGTGKSTTGIGYVMHHPEKKVLVLCFGQANAAELAFKYPQVSKSTVVGTAHAMARRHLSPELNARVATRWSSVTLRAELPLVGARGDMRTAAITANILKDFFLSCDEKVDPYLHGKSARKENKASEEAIAQCCDYAQRLWLAMNTADTLPFMRIPGNINNPISIPHDAYLKRFIMMGLPLGYDTIIFDEAQDANPIMLKLLRDQVQHGAKILMLGDRHQAIYAFRGAINAMEPENLPHENATILPLTQSWRFGPKTATWANLILRELKGETLAIEGLGKDGYFDKDRDALTCLSRTNAELIQHAVSRNGEGVHWVGGIDRYRIGILNDAWALNRGRINDIQDYYIKKNYRNWAEFVEVAEYDRETKIIHDLVETYRDLIPSLVTDLRKNAVPNEAQAQLVLSTLHNSKGLEWDHVRISDDFGFSPVETAEQWLAGDSVSFPEQELNLIYVGVTRARKNVYPSKDVRHWAKELHEHRNARVRNWAEHGKAEREPQSEPAPRRSSRRHPGAGPFSPVDPFRSRH